MPWCSTKGNVSQGGLDMGSKRRVAFDLDGWDYPVFPDLLCVLVGGMSTARRTLLSRLIRRLRATFRSISRPFRMVMQMIKGKVTKYSHADSSAACFARTTTQHTLDIYE